MTKKSPEEVPKEYPKITEFEFVSHDFISDDKFDSSQVSKDDYEKVITGKGLNEKEAAENAIEELLVEEGDSVDILLIAEKAETLDEVYYEFPMVSSYVDEDGESESDGYRDDSSGEMWYFLSIRYNLPK
jgi:hypothetical protein